MCPYSYLWWHASPCQELWQRVSFNGNRNESQASTARTFKRPVLQHGTSIHRFPVYQIRAQRCSHMACRLLRHRWRRWGWDTRWRLMGMWRRQTAPGRTLFLCNYTTLNPLFDDLFFLADSPVVSWKTFKVLEGQAILRNHGCYQMRYIFCWAIVHRFELLFEG